jgi:hypothetical protein
MKLYELDFSFFDGSDWKHVAMTITADSLESLKAKFLEETIGILGNVKGESTKDSQEKLWSSIEKDIEIVALPLVNKHYLQ